MSFSNKHLYETDQSLLPCLHKCFNVSGNLHKYYLICFKMEWKFPVYNYTEKKFVNLRISNIFSDEYLKAFTEFIHYYVPDVIVPNPNKFPSLKPRNERVCRFCGRD